MNTDWKDVLSGLAAAESPDVTENCEAMQSKEPSDNAGRKKSVTLFYEKKGRGGKQVTILADFVGTDDEGIEKLASELKKKLGTGGSVREREILIQGDRRNDIRQFLNEKGFKVKG